MDEAVGPHPAPEQLQEVADLLPAGVASVLWDVWTTTQYVWQNGVLGVDIGRILVAAAILLAFLVVRRLFTRIVLTRLARLAQRTSTGFDDQLVAALRDPVRFVPVVLGVFFATEYLDLRDTALDVSVKLRRTMVVIALFWAFFNMVGPLSGLIRRLRSVFTPAMVAWLVKALKATVALVGGATILEVWGIAVGPIVAGLGLFGVAVALGAQDLFKNLIAGMLILAEKRFNPGDWVKVDGVVEGTVESIGFRSTLIRRFDMAPVYVPNAKLSDSAVTNFSEMTFRRIYWVIGVEYRTTIAQLRAIRDAIEAYLRDSPDFAKPPDATLFVRIDRFSDSSIDIMLYCFTVTTRWGEWLEIKERLAYRIKEIVEDAGTGFAFPSTSVYVAALPPVTPGGELPEAFAPPEGR